MKGTILDFSIQQNQGIISGEDGKRYEFVGQHWNEHVAPEKGMTVDFTIEPLTEKAVSVYLISKQPSPFKTSNNNAEESYSIVDWTKKCFQNYTNFSGRARRKEYWLFYLATLIISILAQTIDHLIRSDLMLFNLLWNLAVVIPVFAAGARRLHDTGRSGWWQLLILTVIGIIPLIVLLALDTKQETNKWGHPAK